MVDLIHCPNCNSTNIEAVKKVSDFDFGDAFLGASTFGIGGGSMGMKEKIVFQCSDCGKYFKVDAKNVGKKL